ncbi:MAG: M48 family metallopeptidase [Burkholderiales bacterium]|nr:M48 family metallopeptidase [Burkholderiales bacterium]
MRLPLLFLLFLIVLPARCPAQALPDLGDASQAVFTPTAERRMGESIMERVRMDRAYRDDPVVTDYLNELGNRLVAASPDSRQSFEFFLLDDLTVNAFALPGGFIGVHAGLILTAQTESELAGVLAHEVAHVTQRHIARMIAGQERNQLVALAALAVGMLAARSNSQIGEAVIAGTQAAAIQNELNFSRDNEREADRVGVQILQQAGFDVSAMPLFMERLQRANRVYEFNAAPAYLRTHPVTTERIADLENRIASIGYKQVPDNVDFQIVRARVRANTTDPHQAVIFFTQALKDRRFINEAATRYGLALALLRAKDYDGAKRELAELEALLPRQPAVAALRGQLLVASGDYDAAVRFYAKAVQAHPNYRALVYDRADALILSGDADAALRAVEERLRSYPDDTRLYILQSRAYAAQGKRLLQHKAQAEAYARQGMIGAAVEQLQIASRSGDGDFYQLSTVEARLRELRTQLKAREKERRQEK